VRKRAGSPAIRAIISVLGVAGLVVAVGTMAVGSVPSADGKIFACYSSSNVRIIDQEAGAACKKGERQLQWNQVGPQGLPGEQGIQGPPGPAGEPAKSYVWTEIAINVPTVFQRESDDLLPAGARVQATSFDVVEGNAHELPQIVRVRASVGSAELASFEKHGDQIDKTLSPERTLTTASKLRIDMEMSAQASRVDFELRFGVKDPEQIFN